MCDGTFSCWSKSTRISQSQACSNCPLLVSGGGPPCPCSPSRTKGVFGTALSVLDGKALLAVPFVSIVAARHLSTWLCLHIYRPFARLTLQHVRMCLRVARVEHSERDGSSFSHCWRFWNERWKLLPVSISHCPCFAWVTAWAHLVASFCRTSRPTNYRHSDGGTLFPKGRLWPRPKLPLNPHNVSMLECCLCLLSCFFWCPFQSCCQR